MGYDYAYTRDSPSELQQAGLSNDLSVKVDTAAKATVGYKVSGRYLVMVGRPSLTPDEVIALQINKGSSYGYNFGLDLSVGVHMSPVLPQNGEDLAAATFGVFGPQIVADVSKSISTLEAWTNGALEANTAALTIDTAKSLLTAVTGVNADNAIAEATGKLKDALAKWNGLVGQGSAELQTLAWNLLDNPSDKALVLKLLADLRDNASFNQSLSDGLQSLHGQSWLMGISEAVGAASPLSLGEYQDDVARIAGFAVDVLSDGDGNDNILTKLQAYILHRFRLTDVIATATDPAELDQWVTGFHSAAID